MDIDKVSFWLKLCAAFMALSMCLSSNYYSALELLLEKRESKQQQKQELLCVDIEDFVEEESLSAADQSVVEVVYSVVSAEHDCSHVLLSQ